MAALCRFGERLPELNRRPWINSKQRWTGCGRYGTRQSLCCNLTEIWWRKWDKHAFLVDWKGNRKQTKATSQCWERGSDGQAIFKYSFTKFSYKIIICNSYDNGESSYFKHFSSYTLGFFPSLGSFICPASHKLTAKGRWVAEWTVTAGYSELLCSVIPDSVPPLCLLLAPSFLWTFLLRPCTDRTQVPHTRGFVSQFGEFGEDIQSANKFIIDLKFNPCYSTSHCQR